MVGGPEAASPDGLEALGVPSHHLVLLGVSNEELGFGSVQRDGVALCCVVLDSLVLEACGRRRSDQAQLARRVLPRRVEKTVGVLGEDSGACHARGGADGLKVGACTSMNTVRLMNKKLMESDMRT